jgi:hypothetical protein
MAMLACSYLATEVDLSEERERHIRSHHPDLLPTHRERIIETVADPDQVRRSLRAANAKLFTKWFSDVRHGKHVVVVVISDPGRKAGPWVVTAYLARKLAEGEIEWRKS